VNWWLPALYRDSSFTCYGGAHPAWSPRTGWRTLSTCGWTARLSAAYRSANRPPVVGVQGMSTSQEAQCCIHLATPQHLPCQPSKRGPPLRVAEALACCRGCHQIGLLWIPPEARLLPAPGP
jgi:hypothetical protein